MSLNLLARCTLVSKSGIPKDNIVNDFAFKDDTLGATAGAAAIVSRLTAFYGGNNASGVRVCQYLAPSHVHAVTGINIDIYNLGDPITADHGSPIYTGNTGALADPLASSGLPSEVAAVLSIHADLAGIAEEGGPTSIPTPAAAIRMGAPATHTGNPRPKARRRGKLYLGPLMVNALVADGNGQVRFNAGTDAFVQTILQAATTLKAAGSTDMPWCVWSRRDNVLRPVTGGSMDNAPDIQRRRGVPSTSRTTFS